jgi:hypothetical protein
MSFRCGCHGHAVKEGPIIRSLSRVAMSSSLAAPNDMATPQRLCMRDTNCPRGHGTRCQFVQFTATVATAGRFQLVFRYTNGGTTNLPMKLAVNGVTKSSSLAFNPTGSSSTWKEVTFNVDLVAGQNQVRLTGTTTSGIKLDNLSIA